MTNRPIVAQASGGLRRERSRPVVKRAHSPHGPYHTYTVRIYHDYQLYQPSFWIKGLLSLYLYHQGALRGPALNKLEGEAFRVFNEIDSEELTKKRNKEGVEDGGLE